ncbi:tRNA-uridine aminocarboxypropyltransferase [Kistimonas asteriae]|uniref:tRNA-uridine aminocarboxypropyltransferase n=1 Tax=Kistimonas asteriae TaxID=517724 RepID=UPI001BA4731B|nr:DTW domain-containing protein [Kistimonas asteriae]
MSRISCPRCGRPESVCYCHDLIAYQAPVDLLILQHPDESRHALNTARIVTLSVGNAEILVGEDFSSDTYLMERLNDPGCQPWLLFPKEGAVPLNTVVNAGSGDRKPLFILLDATWRKARKIYYLSTCLHTLPAVQITTDKLSAYRIRKVPAPGYLSTVEAAVDVLRAFDHDQFACDSMLAAFDRLIGNQITAMGESLYARNYEKNQMS